MWLGVQAFLILQFFCVFLLSGWDTTLGKTMCAHAHMRQRVCDSTTIRIKLSSSTITSSSIQVFSGLVSHLTAFFFVFVFILFCF